VYKLSLCVSAPSAARISLKMRVNLTEGFDGPPFKADKEAVRHDRAALSLCDRTRAP